MKSAEPRHVEELGFISRRIESWLNNDYEFDGYSMEEVREQYSAVEGRDEDFSRYLKDAMLHVTSVSYDAALEGRLEEKEFDKVLDSAREHVVNHYFQDTGSPDPVIPEISDDTRQFSLQGTTRRQQAMDELAEASLDRSLETWYREITGTSPDRIIGVSGGGIEAGIIASEVLDAELDIVRCSPRKRSDEQVHSLKESDYSGEDVLILDDIRDKGRAEEALLEYFEDEAENAVFEATIPEHEFLH